MTPNFDVFSIIMFLGMTQGLFLVFLLLFNKKGTLLTNRLLGLSILPFALHLFQNGMLHSRLMLLYPHCMQVAIPLLLCGGPSLYFYTKVMTSREFTFKPIHWLHLIGPLAMLSYMIPFYFKDAEYKRQYIQNILDGEWSDIYVLMACGIVYMTGYLVVCAQLMIRHLRRVKHFFSSIEDVQLRWLRNLILLMLVSIISAVIYPVFGLHSNSSGVVAAFIALMVYVIGYMGLNQHPVFERYEAAKTVRRYETSDLAPERSIEYKEKLIAFMHDKKPFLESQLTLSDLADQLAIPVRHLSQVINEHFHQNFFDFVNAFRVEEAKKRLLDDAYKHFTVLAVGLDVGFNSKSAFNAAFKKHAGVTPSEVRRTLDYSKSA